MAGRNVRRTLKERERRRKLAGTDLFKKRKYIQEYGEKVTKEWERKRLEGKDVIVTIVEGKPIVVEREESPDFKKFHKGQTAEGKKKKVNRLHE